MSTRSLLDIELTSETEYSFEDDSGGYRPQRGNQVAIRGSCGKLLDWL